MAYLEPVETSLPADGVTFLQLKQYLESREGRNPAADDDDYEEMDSSDSSCDYDEVNIDESRAASEAYFDVDDRPRDLGSQFRDSRSSVHVSTSSNEFQGYQLSPDVDDAARRQQGQPQSIDASEINRDSVSPLHDSHDRNSGLLHTVPESLYNSHQPPDTAINPTSPVYRTQDDVTAHNLSLYEPGEVGEYPPPLPRPREQVLPTNTVNIDTDPDTTQPITSLAR
jgi:hypothetical protein